MALLGLGLLLGLRHAADPDHVVAVTAITARTRRIKPAMLFGTVWGLGHTLTLFVVGAGIILFNWIVPPRVGLAMEFCVALALPVAAAARQWGGATRVIRLSTGALSLVFGLWLVYQIGWRDGLFLVTPTWAPH
jgi:high-affinity nickel-transport protein